ncbi:ubiquinone anaerobic biosynthesis accessory factor UbiT [Chitinimonas lacunae]|uniref:Ubiquinone biosynthesis accessory factor UbiT n=1 Tax=Chitinimonas lacunae TaxID=1963018 RepID=A0ABV8MPH4_9NEIS
MRSLPPFPPGLAKLGRRLPPALLSLHFTAGLALAQRCRWLEPPPELNGRRFAIDVSDLGLRCLFRCQDGQFRPYWGKTVDLELGAAAIDFFGLLRGEVDADTLFFQRRLRISGDTELGLLVKNWLDATERPAFLRSSPLS